MSTTFQAWAKGNGLDRNISLSENASIVYDPKVNLTLSQMRQKFREFEDLLLILTNSDYNLAWPNISISIGGTIGGLNGIIFVEKVRWTLRELKSA